MMTADMENLTIEAVKDENKVSSRWQETIKRVKAETIKRTKADSKEEFNETELTKLKERANRMEINAEFGFLGEANTLFSLLFENLKEKKVGLSQRAMKVEILNKIVSLHNIKYSYDEAFTWAIKALECLDAKDPASLVIETLNQSAEAFTAKSLFDKAKSLIEKSVALSAETYGKESRAYAKSLVTYADYLSATDQRQKANDMYMIALTIVTKEEGERSVAAAKIMGEMADNNYHSTEDCTIASEQAETAVQVIEEKLGKNNFLIVQPKNAMAGIMKAKDEDIPDEEEKSKLLSEAEKLEADCLSILTATLGNYNPGTSALMMNMGVTYRDSGKNSEAEELLTKSLAIMEKILGEDEEVALGHFHLFQFYFENIKDYGKAEGHLLDSIRIHEKVLGPAFSRLGSLYNWLIRLYRTTGEVDKENEMWEKKDEWEKLQEKKDKEEEDNEEKKEKKQREMTLEELVQFVTVGDMSEP